MIYFQLENLPELPDSNYIAVGVKYTSNQIYIGQLLFNKGVLLPTTSQTLGSVHAYKKNTSTISTKGGSFSAANYVIKIPPKSLSGLKFETSKKINSILFNILQIYYA